jgi:hypothetical protein
MVAVSRPLSAQLQHKGFSTRRNELAAIRNDKRFRDELRFYPGAAEQYPVWNCVLHLRY